jgi:iron complex transport system substrate-binding protein
MGYKIRHIIRLVFPILALFALMTSAAIAKTVTDQMGREVVLPDNPRRIVSLAPSITEIIFAIGQSYRLKGVTQFSDYPPGTTKLPKVGSYVRLDLERIVALNPDLCLATKDGNPKQIIDRLQSLNIPVYAVDPRNLNMVMKTILEIARLLQASTKAETLIEDMRSRIQRVKSRVRQTHSRPRVFFQIGISPIVSIGSDTFIHELIVLAGGKNVAAGNTSYPRFSREQVLALAPEVFIITSMARGAVFETIKTEWGQWPTLPAVRDQRIHLVDSNLFDRPSPRLVEALELLVELIHPELFKQAP